MSVGSRRCATGAWKVSRATAPVLKLEVYIDPPKIEAGPPPSGDFAALAKDSLQAYLPKVHDGSLSTMLGPDAPAAIAARVADEPALIGKTVRVSLPLSDTFAELAQGKTPKVLNPRFTAAQIKVFEAMKAKGLVCISPSTGNCSSTPTAVSRSGPGSAGAITGTFLDVARVFRP